MAYIGGGNGPVIDWEAREDIWQLNQDVTKLAERVAALEARNEQLEAKLASTAEALDTVGGAA